MPFKRYCIIGQGLAGSVLGLLLMERGVSLEIVDDGHLSSSSKIAAGMWNPVSFRRLILSWEAPRFLPVMEKVYRSFEKKLGVSFFHPTPLARIFSDHGSANDWDQRSTHPEVGPFLSAAQNAAIPLCFHEPHGHGIVNDCGWMDIPVFLDAARDRFAKSGILRTGHFDMDTQSDPETLFIFCTGWKSPEDPHFAPVNITPNKGQLLTIETEAPVHCMVNFGNFIIPIGDKKFRLGATHELEPTHIQPTAEGIAELKNSLEAVFPKPFQVLDHEAGYRPTTHDRKPVVGIHPHHPNLGLFNGLGARGVLQAPLIAMEFMDYLLHDKPLPKEIDILRYFKKK